MVAKYKTIALLAVKGNSERVPKKNIRSFGDTTLLELKLKQLLKAGCVEKIVVSSESSDVLDIAGSFKEVMVHKRNPFYSSSEIPMSRVYSHLASEMDCENIMWVPVTNPLTGPKIYNEAVQMFEGLDNKYDCILSCVKINEYLLNDFKPVNFTRNPWLRSQDLEGYHALSFAVNVLKRKDMLEWGSLVGKKPYYVVLTREESKDIDFLDDFEFCEFLYNKNRKKYL